MTTLPNCLGALEDFLVRLQYQQNMSVHTVQAYRRDLTKFIDFIRLHDLNDFSALTPKLAIQFPAKLHAQGLGGKSIQRALSATRSFYQFLIESNKASINPFMGVRAPKAQKKLPSTLSVDEVAHLLSAMPDTKLGLRDKAIIELIYSAGLRLSELVNVNIEAYQASDGMLSVMGKGNKQRLAPIGEKAKMAIETWIKIRAELISPNEDALFISQRGTRLANRTIQARLNYWAKQSGLNRKLHPHMLRHSFASHILESSGNLRAVQEMLGHANISTTQIYTHLDFQHLAKVYDQAHPRARKRK